MDSFLFLLIFFLFYIFFYDGEAAAAVFPAPNMITRLALSMAI
jgi:hypothetical protein